jgi:hypothetical protein
LYKKEMNKVTKHDELVERKRIKENEESRR